MGLVDVFTLHPLFFQSCSQAHALHHLHGGGTIRCQLGIGARNALKRPFAQHIALPIHHLGVCAPQHQLPHGIGECGVGHRQSLLHQLGGYGGIGRQQDLVGCAVLDLGHQLSAGPKRQLGLVPAVLGKCLGNLLHRLHEVGGHRDQNFSGTGHAPSPTERGGHHKGSNNQARGGFHGGQRV